MWYMHLIGFELIGLHFGKRCGEHVIGKANYSNFMRQGCNENFLFQTGFELQLVVDFFAQIGHTSGVAAEIAAPHFNQGGETVLQPLTRSLNLGGARLNFGFEAGIERLEFLILLRCQCFQSLVLQLDRLAIQSLARDQHNVIVVPGFGDVAVYFTR